MRNFLLVLFFAGILLIVINQLIKAHMRPPPVQYKYLERDLDVMLREEPLASATFSTMFRGEDVQFR